MLDHYSHIGLKAKKRRAADSGPKIGRSDLIRSTTRWTPATRPFWALRYCAT